MKYPHFQVFLTRLMSGRHATIRYYLMMHTKKGVLQVCRLGQKKAEAMIKAGVDSGS